MRVINTNEEFKSYVESLNRYGFTTLLECDIDNFFSYIYVNPNNNKILKEYYDKSNDKHTLQEILDERLEYWRERS